MNNKKTLEAIQKKLEVELCRRNFWSFCKHMDNGFFNDNKPHLKTIAEAFQDIFEGRVKKLAVSIAPRAGKSYITSLFCAWVLGKEPETSIMRNCYAAKLAEKFSKDIRDGIIQNPKYKEIFPEAELNPKNTAIDSWSIGKNSQPSYFCAGVGGAITGFGCKRIAILDDPIKNIEEALSELVIDNIWNWYTSTHLSRLESGCAEIHIATRWTKYDPIGRLTDPESESYDPDMKVIRIPALDDEGNSFCEAIKTTEEYLQMRKVTDEFIWEAEFMQNPIEEKGLLYPPGELNKFEIRELRGAPDAVLAFTDTADKGTDFLSCVIGYRYGNDTYIVDVVFTQEGVEITEPLVAQKIIDHRVDVMWIESNNGGYQFARNVRRLINGRSFCNVIALPTTKNKETRILMNAGYIKDYYHFRKDYKPGSEYDKFYRQFTGYVRLGKNVHDDAPDSVTGLAENTKYRIYKKPTKQPDADDEDYKDPDEEFDELRKYMTGNKVNKEIFKW